MNKLSQLRALFVLYMLAKTIVEIVLGSRICLDSIDAGSVSLFAHLFGSHLTVPLLAILGNGIMLLLGLGVFYFLLQKQNWARIVLLIIGWINVVDAFSSFLFRFGASRLLSHFGFGADWDQLLYMDQVTDILGLIYWGFLIYMLQFNGKVKQEFFASPPEAVPEQRG